MKYWVIKGRPAENDFGEFLQAGRVHRWRTGRPPKAWSPGDRLFFWRGAPICEVIGVGELCGLTSEIDENGKHIFEVMYKAPVLDNPVAIDLLRTDRIVGDASFLKSGPSGTVFPISAGQAQRLFAMILDLNESLSEIWQDLAE